MSPQGVGDSAGEPSIEEPSALAGIGGWPAVLGRLMAHEDLSADEAAAALGDILVGGATPAQVAAFVTALRIKGETVEEMAGLVRAMLDLAEPLVVPGKLVDTCVARAQIDEIIVGKIDLNDPRDLIAQLGVLEDRKRGATIDARAEIADAASSVGAVKAGEGEKG